MGKRLLRRSALLLLMSAGVAQQASAAQCEYSVLNDWGGGFQAEIRITNDGVSAINGWAVNWEYTDGSSINHGWNANISDAAPYSATALNWNASIAPGSSVAFGFVGNNGSGQAQMPVVAGDVCATIASSSSVQSSSSIALSSSSSLVASSSSSSVISSSVASSSSVVASSSSVISSSSSVAESSSSLSSGDSWQLDSTLSQLTFSTTKKIHVVENMTFTELSGGISSDGIATLNIALASVESGIDIRSERMRNFLFETSLFPSATVTLPVDTVELSSLAVGESVVLNIIASLNLHGVTNDITTNLKVSRLSTGQIMVQNVAPILVVADAYDLEGGIEELRTIANLNSIGKVVPVDFTLFFSAQ